MLRLTAIAVSALALSLPATADSLPAVLGRMDQAGPAFRGITAQFDRVIHTAIIDDSSTDGGAIRMQRKGKDLRVLLQFTKPEPRSIAFDNKSAQVYNPKINTVQIFDLGKQKSLVEQFLLLGFGASGKDLAKAYNIKYLGEENVGKTKAARLELIPKSDKVREHYTRIELWIADGGYPIQQKLYEPSGNYMRMTYSGIKLNPPLETAQLSIDLPADVKREYPQR
ncbi:MAG: outer membrane lipoprotein carrier protein LolA [Bryobacteraceae bacterium]